MNTTGDAAKKPGSQTLLFDSFDTVSFDRDIASNFALTFAFVIFMLAACQRGGWTFESCSHTGAMEAQLMFFVCLEFLAEVVASAGKQDLEVENCF